LQEGSGLRYKISDGDFADMGRGKKWRKPILTIPAHGIKQTRMPNPDTPLGTAGYAGEVGSKGPEADEKFFL